MNSKRALIAFTVLLLSTLASGQKKVDLKHADKIVGTKQGNKRIDWLIGNVVFVQNKTTIYCDSAIFNKRNNTVEAFGKIRITEGDSVTVTSRRLIYDGNKRIAHLRNNVVFTKLKTATLYTDFLDFDRQKNIARFFNGGKLVDTTNTLTSKKGYYDLNTNMSSFKTDVLMVNPEYTLTSDTLQYHTKTKIIFFRDLTNVKDNDGKITNFKTGYYDTNKKVSAINRGDIESPSYRMEGDEYLLDDKTRFYRARNNVVMTSKDENMIVYGDYGDYWRTEGITKVYGNAYVAKILDEGDTLFVSADTLVSVEDKDPNKERLLAYRNVRIFKPDLQGKADSLAYVAVDSMIYFYHNPVLWTDGNQMTADSIKMLVRKKSVDKIFLTNNSFVISKDSLDFFNQIKGRKMIAHFNGKSIHHTIVQGNGESIYFALQEQQMAVNGKLVTVTAFSGMNKIICSNMRINFMKGRVDNISFYVRPEASFIPPHELGDKDKMLKGFQWRPTEKPDREQVVKPKKPEKKGQTVPEGK